LKLATTLFSIYHESRRSRSRFYILKGGVDMNLELSLKEKEMLIGVLKDYIPELRGEIASGAKHDFKQELKDEEAVLKGILEKLNALK
jgi:hypothetical protein